MHYACNAKRYTKVRPYAIHGIVTHDRLLLTDRYVMQIFCF